MSDLTFNTGRDYTQYGQRIAARAIDGGVYFVDIDRGLDGFFPDIELSRHALLAAYDGTWRKNFEHCPPSLDPRNVSGKYGSNTTVRLLRLGELKRELEEAAQALTAKQDQDASKET